MQQTEVVVIGVISQLLEEMVRLLIRHGREDGDTLSSCVERQVVGIYQIVPRLMDLRAEPVLILDLIGQLPEFFDHDGKLRRIFKARENIRHITSRIEKDHFDDDNAYEEYRSQPLDVVDHIRPLREDLPVKQEADQHREKDRGEEGIVFFRHISEALGDHGNAADNAQRRKEILL